MENKKRIFVVIFTLLLTIIGGTFAWYTYQSRKSALVLTIGDLTDAKVTLKPYQINETMVPVNTYENQVYTQVDVNASSNIELSLYYKINEISEDLINNGLKYTITSSDSLDGTYSLVKTGDFTSYANNRLDILTVELSANAYYRIYVWLDSNFGNQSGLQNLSLDIELNGMLTSIAPYSEPILNGADPVLETGMIPVTIANDGAVTTADTSSEWYSYEDKQWANAVLVNGDNRANYYESDGTTIKANATVNKDDILAYYVWVPRYKYEIWTTENSSTGSEQEINIVFEDADTEMSVGTTVGSYRTHPAFTFGTNELNGIWVGKFETTGTGDNPTILPNESSLRDQNLRAQFETSLKFSGGILSGTDVSFSGSSTYGLTANTNSHMMKNNEWGAVAYLSHSKYGLNQEIYINNSSNYFTGRSGGGIGSDSLSKTVYGNYSWLGQVVDTSGNIGNYASDITLGTNASTTGNVTGIYDMSGGAEEYVMGNLGNDVASSGFDEMINSNYYDIYLLSSSLNARLGIPVTVFGFCTLETCGGHALNETKGWYSDYASYDPSTSAVWYMRGNVSSNLAEEGIFSSSYDYGTGGSYVSWRSVLVDDFVE